MHEFLLEFWADFSKPENIVGHIAYILLIASMMMRSMNWLRALAIMAGSISAVYYWTLGDNVSMFWESMFTLVNITQLIILQVENRRGNFSEEETMFVKLCLPNIERLHARRLMKLGVWTEVDEGTTLITEDTLPQKLQFIGCGTATVFRNGKLLGKVNQGDFLGEMSYLTGNNATATAVTAGRVRYLAFERKRLKEHLDKHPEVRHALEASFNRNLIDKLSKSNTGILATSNSDSV